MDTKNVIAAISLSAAVIILYGLFFAPPAPDPNKVINQKNTTSQSSATDAPSLDQTQEIKQITRDEAIKNEERILLTKH